MNPKVCVIVNWQRFPERKNPQESDGMKGKLLATTGKRFRNPGREQIYSANSKPEIRACIICHAFLIGLQ